MWFIDKTTGCRRLLCSLALLILLPTAVYAGIYRWKDEQGIIHFSDKDPENNLAEDIEKEVESKINLFSDDIRSKQAKLLSTFQNKLAPGDSKKTELFLITFAGDASQQVFMHESLYVQNLFSKRYHTDGHSVALINHASATSNYLVATDENLATVLHAYAKLMTQNDILYLYLTSHGSRNHKLSVKFPPYAVKNFGPDEVRQMLDDAGIKWRIIVVSACYSGGFVAPLKSPYTIVATASDATHTSFGCADDRDFTYYGEAVFKNLMSNGVGIVSALDQARKEVYSMEETMQTDHHSNPQFFEGEEIRKHLLEFENSPTPL
jgi:hypothetical protein